jgi:hypothetical protein
MAKDSGPSLYAQQGQHLDHQLPSNFAPRSSTLTQFQGNSSTMEPDDADLSSINNIT